MGAPVLVGAGIGAISSLAMGKDPLMGAAMGGLSGGAFGGAEGFGSGFTEGGLFSLGSQAGGGVATGLANAPTMGGLELAGAASGTAASAGTAAASGAAPNFMQSYKPMEAGLDYPTMLSKDAMQATNPVINTSGSMGANLNYRNPDIAPRFMDTSASESLLTSTRPYQQGGLSASTTEAPSTGLLSSAYNAIADMSPLEQTQLGMTAIDAATPQEQAQQMMQGGGQIKPAKEVTVGTPLAINVPSTTFKRRFA